MLWTDEDRAELEENRLALERARSELAPFLLDDELQVINSESSDIEKQAVDLGRNVGERIFALEKEKIRSRSSIKTSLSRKSKVSNVS